MAEENLIVADVGDVDGGDTDIKNEIEESEGEHEITRDHGEGNEKTGARPTRKGNHVVHVYTLRLHTVHDALHRTITDRPT